MTSRIGSDQNFIATTSAGILDDQANSIVSSDTTFGSSPLGVAARTQALFGIANANFNLTPPDPTLPIVDNDNPLPYWTVTNGTEGDGSAIAVFDDATSTWGVELSLGTSITDAAISMTTRSFLLNDDNLALRQRALSVLSKSGTAGGTAAEWNLVLSAEYFSEAGDSLSTHAIGTVTDVTSWTSIAGTTTAGGSAISSSAAYVDMTFTMTALGTVTGTAKATIKSLLLTTTTPATGGGGFVVTDAFTSSGTWTRPSGVDYVSVIAVGGGGGGASGGLDISASAGRDIQGSGGGGASRLAVLRDIYVGDIGTVSVGIGAGGSGGTARTKIKGLGTAFTAESFNGINGSAGGAASFGAYLTVGGGGGGIGGTVQPATSTSFAAGGTAAGASTTIVFGIEDAAGGAGGRGASTSTTPGSGTAGGTAALLIGITQLPLTSATYLTQGEAGAAGSVTKPSGTAIFGVAGSAGVSGWIAGGGGGASVKTQANGAIGTAGAGGGGGGGGGGANAGLIQQSGGTTGTIIIKGGDGGAGGAYSGAGGGAGAAAWITVISAQGTGSTLDASSGAGGAGGGGFVIVGYTA